jgi:hypothetical protein
VSLLKIPYQILPTKGPAWDNIVKEAVKVSSNMSLGSAVGDMTDQTTVYLYARSLKAAKTQNAGDRQVVVDVLNKFPSASLSAPQGSLGPSRNVACIALAADQVNHITPTLANWLKNVIRHDFGGKSIISTHNQRPNNWGTHAGASRMAVDRLIGDTADFGLAVKTFKGWLGDRAQYAGFKWGDLSWQADQNKPVGINPQGSTKQGHNIDGVLPDDQRRQGGFTWPPSNENYVYEALQGVVLQAELCYGAGLDDVWLWQNEAIKRAMVWLHNVNQFPAEGDDTFIPHVINSRCATKFPAPTPAGEGKGWGFTDWTHSVPFVPPTPPDCSAQEAALKLAQEQQSAAAQAYIEADRAVQTAKANVAAAQQALDDCKA